MKLEGIKQSKISQTKKEILYDLTYIWNLKKFIGYRRVGDEWRWLKRTTFQLESEYGASLVAQWLRICLLMQETRVRALVWEDPTCRGATKPMRHNYWACALEPTSHNYWSPRATTTEARVRRACALQQQKPPRWEACTATKSSPPCSLQLEKSRVQQQRPNVAKNK